MKSILAASGALENMQPLPSWRVRPRIALRTSEFACFWARNLRSLFIQHRIIYAQKPVVRIQNYILIRSASALCTINVSIFIIIIFFKNLDTSTGKLLCMLWNKKQKQLIPITSRENGKHQLKEPDSNVLLHVNLWQKNSTYIHTGICNSTACWFNFCNSLYEKQ